ncbi:MAG: TRAP transporter small permease [Deltaproteobacteria bacterium]|nr:MAG: TRAP transporter small permease [Deltaproteobacteria bacterium]RLB08290.1 MAG: TRAP transporter small permease [Deltaproteobacteria bacterium]
MSFIQQFCIIWYPRKKIQYSQRNLMTTQGPQKTIQQAILNNLFIKIQKTSTAINQVTEWSLFVLGFAMAIIIATQVFFRYALNHSLFWSEELGRMLLVWISFLGATVAYKRKAHIGIDFIVQKLPGNLATKIRILTYVFSLCFFSIMIIYGTKFTLFIKFQKSPALGISKSIPFAVIPLSGIFFLIHGITLLMETILSESKK